MSELVYRMTRFGKQQTSTHKRRTSAQLGDHECARDNLSYKKKPPKGSLFVIRLGFEPRTPTLKV